MFRFTIRELVLLTIIVATSVGWCIDHQRLTWRAESAEMDGRVIATQREQIFEALDAIVPEWRERVAESDKASLLP